MEVQGRAAHSDVPASCSVDDTAEAEPPPQSALAFTIEVQLENGGGVLLDVPWEASTTIVLQELVVAGLGLPVGTEGSLVQFDEAWQRDVVQPLWLPAPLISEDGHPRFPTGSRYQFRVRPSRVPDLPAREQEAVTTVQAGEPVPRAGWEDSEYFNEYGETVIHLQMLADGRRNDAYAAAFSESIGGMTVLDVGAGTGFLSVLAARAGAKRGRPLAGLVSAATVMLTGMQCTLLKPVAWRHEWSLFAFKTKLMML